MAEKRKPDIRFKGYADDWEWRKLEDVVEFLDTMRKPLEGAKRIPGPYPYYGASGIVDYVDGYLFDEELVLLSEDGANITDRNYPVCFLASGKYWVNNHAHVLRTKDENENNFICNSLECKDYKQYNSGMAMPKLNQEVCRCIPISCPSFDEQKKIGDYFRKLDNLITLHQSKWDKLVSVKKFMLQKMFPQNGFNVPEIRFAGFTDVWEQRKLGDVCSEIGDGLHSAPFYDENGKYYFINGNNLVNGTIQIDDRETKKVSSEIFEQNDKHLDETTVLLSINGTIGNLAYYKGENVMLGKSSAYLKAKNVDKSFLFISLQTSTIMNNFMLSLTGTTIKNLGLEAIKKTTIQVPEKDEQIKIGLFFSNLDNLITFHQSKLEKLKEIKKSMLEKMFI